MTVGIDPQSGILEQFSGYLGLEPLDLTAYASRTLPMDVLLGPERTRRSQVIKQADVVMLLALLSDRFTPVQRIANYRYYEPRCGHGSSLSPAMHALVAARLGDAVTAERYFHQAAAIDLDDAMGNAAGGVHIAALGGLWQAVVFGFAGLVLCPDGIRLDPHLPLTWRTLRFRLRWRKRRVQVTLRCQPLTLTLTLERGRPMRVYVGGLDHRLRPSEPWVCQQGGADDTWTEVGR
jgi:kojibiose phosphorylase